MNPGDILGHEPMVVVEHNRVIGTDSGIVAEMDARSKPGLKDPFEEAIDEALSFLPAPQRQRLRLPTRGVWRIITVPGG